MLKKTLFDNLFLLPNNTRMQIKAAHYENNPEFQEFLSREFDKTAVDATVEELAEFAFGSMDTAIEAFEEKIKNES